MANVACSRILNTKGEGEWNGWMAFPNDVTPVHPLFCCTRSIFFSVVFLLVLLLFTSLLNKADSNVFFEGTLYRFVVKLDVNRKSGRCCSFACRLFSVSSTLLLIYFKCKLHCLLVSRYGILGCEY